MEETQRYDSISLDILQTYAEQHLISSRHDARNNAKNKTKQEERKTEKKRKIAFNPLQESAALIDTKTNNSNDEVRVTDNIFNNNVTVLTKAFIQSNTDVIKLKNMNYTDKNISQELKESAPQTTGTKKKKRNKTGSSAKENIRTNVRGNNPSDISCPSSTSNYGKCNVSTNTKSSKGRKSKKNVSYSIINYEFHEANHAIIDTFAVTLDFFMRNDKRNGYCLVCDMIIQVCQYKDIRKNLCRHIRSKKHIHQLSMMVEDDKKFVNREKFNKLTLAREYIVIKNAESVKCLLCDSKNLPCMIKKDEPSLHEHITSDTHIDAKISWELPIQNALQFIHDQFQSQYNAKSHRCDFCHYESPSEHCFMKHLRVSYHMTRLMDILDYTTKFKYYFCNVCLILWFGSIDIGNYHHEQIEHKQIVMYGPLINDIPEEVIQFLEISGQNGEALLNHSNHIYNDEMINLVLYNFETDLGKYIPNLKVYPFGSRISGLALPGSDIDVFLDCGKSIS